jgi:hypothetical protein
MSSSNIESTGETVGGQRGHVTGRRIGRADGPDQVSPGYFAKKSSIFNKINLQSGLLSQTFL